jgi:hypothetical protein
MRNRARLFTLDTNGDPLKVEDFQWVEDAMNAAHEAAGEAGSMDEWCDTQIGYEWMTKAGREHLTETGDYPERYWQITGINAETGEDQEVEDEDHFDHTDEAE